MHSAAVGFQCPSCVKEGSRTTRQARTPYGGTRVADARLTTFVLIGINVAVWLGVQASGGRTSTLLDKLSLLPASSLRRSADGSVVVVKGVSDGAWWQILTSVFTHQELLHIGFNMLALYFLGPMLEQVLGRARYLALYLVSGIAGSAAVMLFSDPHTQSLGASGAIFGLMGALAVVALKVRGQVQSILMWIGFNLIFTFTVSGISWQAHLGGLVTGALLGAVMVYAPRKNRALVQWSVTGAVLVASLALIVVRAGALS
jgi:membrane associated rhomboid family serine protease